MAGRIPQAFINSLIERADIVSVIGTRVELKRAGKSLKGLCPFHDEKTPSFNVNPDKQLYYCFGCGAGGTALTFLREYDRLDFVEAVETLAGIVGVEVPRERGRERPRDSGLCDILERASRTYQDWLRRHPTAHRATDYLKRRGLSGVVAKEFGIGFAPEGWDGVKSKLADVGTERLVDAGLLVRNERGHTYDRFRNRIMFPIRNTKGEVVGFGGRVLGDEQPKYLNSPETSVFNKGQELYGLYEARHAGKFNSAIVVEGYMDVVALAQRGINNAVAALGTAIGEAHFKKLYSSWTTDVVCCFDGDAAGREAAWKAVVAAFPVLTEGRQLRFVLLPDGEDPDSIVASQGAEPFEERVRAAVPVGEFYFAKLEQGLDMERISDRARLCDLALPDIATLPNGMFRRMMIERLAQTAQVAIDVLARRLDQVARAPGAEERHPVRSEGTGESTAMWASTVRSPSGHSSVESRPSLMRKLLRMLVQQPACLGQVDEQQRDAFIAAVQGTLLQPLVEYLASNPESDTPMLVARFLGDPKYKDLSALAEEELEVPNGVMTEFRDGVARLIQVRDKAKRQAMGKNLTLADNDTERLRAIWRSRSEAARARS